MAISPANRIYETELSFKAADSSSAVDTTVIVLLSALATISVSNSFTPPPRFAGTVPATTSTARVPAITRFHEFLIVISIPPVFYTK